MPALYIKLKNIAAEVHGYGKPYRVYILCRVFHRVYISCSIFHRVYMFSTEYIYYVGFAIAMDFCSIEIILNPLRTPLREGRFF